MMGFRSERAADGRWHSNREGIDDSVSESLDGMTASQTKSRRLRPRGEDGTEQPSDSKRDANDSKYTAAAEKAATLGRVKQADMYMYKADHPIWQDINFAPYGFPEVGNLPKNKSVMAPASPAPDALLGGASVFTPSPAQRAQLVAAAAATTPRVAAAVESSPSVPVIATPIIDDGDGSRRRWKPEEDAVLLARAERDGWNMDAQAFVDVGEALGRKLGGVKFRWHMLKHDYRPKPGAQ